jgi:hypothetical protein
MNKMLILISVIFFASCGTSPDRASNESVKETRGEASTSQPSGIDVKATRNGKPLVAFQSASNNTGVGAMLVGNDLSVEITSPDQLWVLSISVSRAKAGVYRLAGTREDGKAMILLTGGNEGNEMMARADSGELKLSEVSETYCSGSFMGKGTDATGNKYTYEGKFSRIKAFRQE